MMWPIFHIYRQVLYCTALSETSVGFREGPQTVLLSGTLVMVNVVLAWWGQGCCRLLHGGDNNAGKAPADVQMSEAGGLKAPGIVLPSRMGLERKQSFQNWLGNTEQEKILAATNGRCRTLIVRRPGRGSTRQVENCRLILCDVTPMLAWVASVTL